MHKFRLYETCPRDGEVLGDESKRDGDGLQDWIVTQDVLKSMSFRGVESLAELAGMWVHYGTCQEYNRDPDEREFASMIMTKRGWVKFDADGTSGSMNMDITQSFWTDMEVIRKKLGLAAGCFDVVRNLSGADVVRYDGAAFDDSSPPIILRRQLGKNLTGIHGYKPSPVQTTTRTCYHFPWLSEENTFQAAIVAEDVAGTDVAAGDLLIYEPAGRVQTYFFARRHDAPRFKREKYADIADLELYDRAAGLDSCDDHTSIHEASSSKRKRQNGD